MALNVLLFILRSLTKHTSDLVQNNEEKLLV